jgi:hypothetical protein
MSVLRMGAARRRHAARALWFLARARMLHALWPAPRIFARLRADMPPGRGVPPDPALMGWALQAWGKRVPWRSDCLVQALAARLWLERSGTEGVLRLGARRVDGGILAHAWLEVGGVPVSGGAPSPALAMFEGAERH